MHKQTTAVRKVSFLEKRDFERKKEKKEKSGCHKTKNQENSLHQIQTRHTHIIRRIKQYYER